MKQVEFKTKAFKSLKSQLIGRRRKSQRSTDANRQLKMKRYEPLLFKDLIGRDELIYFSAPEGGYSPSFDLMKLITCPVDKIMPIQHSHLILFPRR